MHTTAADNRILYKQQISTLEAVKSQGTHAKCRNWIAWINCLYTPCSTAQLILNICPCVLVSYLRNFMRYMQVACEQCMHVSHYVLW